MIVKIYFEENSCFYEEGTKEITLENVEKIHYYPGVLETHIAFEEETTGSVFQISNIREFEVREVANEK